MRRLRSPSAAWLPVAIAMASPLFASGQGTAFTYQGLLSDNGLPAKGSYDLVFELRDAPSGGNAAGAVTNLATAVSNGLFTVTLDYGPGVFDGTALWLEIAAVTNGGGTFVTLSPRQRATSTPYAIAARALHGVVSSTSLSGTYGQAVAFIHPGNTFSGDGSALDNVDAATVNGVAANALWQLGGNVGTIPGSDTLGTTDGASLHIQAGAVGINTDTPEAMLHVAGGHALVRGPQFSGPGHFARLGLGNDHHHIRSVWGEGIRLGSWHAPDAVAVQQVTGNVGIGTTNPVAKLEVNGTVRTQAVEGPGTQPLDLKTNGLRALRLEDNGDSGDFGTESDGAPNVIGGSPANVVTDSAVGGTIGGGGAVAFEGVARPNQAGSDYATVGGGLGNTIQTDAQRSTIAGGYVNQVQSGSDDSTIGGGERNAIETNVLGSTIGGGGANKIQPYAWHATIGGGSVNTIEPNASDATIAGGSSNTAGAPDATICGGLQNKVRPNADYASIGGGFINEIQNGAERATIGGGGVNDIQANAGSATIGGGTGNDILTGASAATIGGGLGNEIRSNALYSTIGGGNGNVIEADAQFATVGGGDSNSGSSWGTVAGGHDNRATGVGSTVAGGGYPAYSLSGNEASGQNSVVAGGLGNRASGEYSSVGGGLDNLASGLRSTTAGGSGNAATDWYATVPGGTDNVAGGEYSFAAGRRAKAIHDGGFAWADSTNSDFATTRDNEFAIRANGGVRIDTGSGPGIALNAANRPLVTRLHDPFTSGAHDGAGRWGLFMEPHTLALGIPAVATKNLEVVKYNADSTYTSLMRVDQAGNLYTTGAVNPPSDRAAKQAFEPVDAEAVLHRVASLPLHTWSYTGSPDTRHIGPVAQDFHAAFNVGCDDKHIATVDADGVALAAIQALSQKLEKENRELRQRVERLEVLIENKARGGTR